MMGPKVSPNPRSTQPGWPLPPSLASSSCLQHSSEHSTTATHLQHIDLQALYSSFGSTGHTLEKIQPQAPMPPNLSESDKELVLALGLEEVYKRMAENHKFHIDLVRVVAAGQKSLEHADQVLFSMCKAAERKYACIIKQEFGVALQTGVHQTEESGEEEEDVQT
jgi:hypothetical protein